VNEINEISWTIEELEDSIRENERLLAEGHRYRGIAKMQWIQSILEEALATKRNILHATARGNALAN
jgi:hypothetical protein